MADESDNVDDDGTDALTTLADLERHLRDGLTAERLAPVLALIGELRANLLGVVEDLDAGIADIESNWDEIERLTRERDRLDHENERLRVEKLREAAEHHDELAARDALAAKATETIVRDAKTIAELRDKIDRLTNERDALFALAIAADRLLHRMTNGWGCTLHPGTQGYELQEALMEWERMR